MAMGSTSKALTRFGVAATRLSMAETARPSAKFAHIANFATTTSRATRPVLAAPTVLSRRAQFTRAYAAATAAAAVPKKKPGKIRTTFKWLWRATYLSLILGVGAVIYDGYLDRNPDEQYAPDPQKKTLVILGESDMTDSQTLPWSCED